ncbi:MAG: hypothetical protein R2860_03585 [Desulfobacterales bacterium]
MVLSRVDKGWLGSIPRCFCMVADVSGITGNQPGDNAAGLPAD